MRREPVTVLYRSSSEPDGVQSRGAGWHSVAVVATPGSKRLTSLGRSFSPGDLLQKEGLLSLYAGGRFVKLPGLRGQRAKESLSQYTKLWTLSYVTAGGTKGDWHGLWQERGALAARMVQLASEMNAPPRAVVLAACACAETVLRYLSREQPEYRRSVQVVRAWAGGLATRAQVEEAAESVLALDGQVRPSALGEGTMFLDNIQYAANVFYYLTQSVAMSYSSVQGVSDAFLFGMTRHRENQRSLAYLVRAILPAWMVCLAIVEGET